MALKLASEKQVLGELIRLQHQGELESIKLTVSLKAIYPLAGTPHLYNRHTIYLIENGLDRSLTTIDVLLLLSALETIKLLDRLSK